jgi:NitT/TauT family transport system permease protein
MILEDEVAAGRADRRPPDAAEVARSRRVPGPLRRVGAVPLWRLVVTAAAIVVWWLFTVGLNGSDPILGRLGPGDAFAALADLVRSGEALADTVTSLRRLGLGLVIATGLGVPLGLLLGSRRGVEQATAPLVQFLRMVSPLAWAPAAVVVLGVGDAPVTFLVGAATIWPMAMGTTAGVRALDPGWHRVAHSLGATPIERLWTVVLPGVRPHVLTALRLALGVGWVVIVPAEMLGVDSGLGYGVLNARDQLAYDQLAATMLLIGIVGFILDGTLQWLLRPHRRLTARTG